MGLPTPGVLETEEIDVKRARFTASRAVDCEEQVLGVLSRFFEQPFALLHGLNAHILLGSDSLPGCSQERIDFLCRSCLGDDSPQVLDEPGALITVVVPLRPWGHSTLLAVSTFPHAQGVANHEQFALDAQRWGVPAATIEEWIETRPAWSKPTLRVMLDKAIEQLNLQLEVEELRLQTNDVSTHLMATYEEISLLHRLTDCLRLSSSDVELAELAIQWLEDVLPAEGIAIKLNNARCKEVMPENVRGRKLLITSGEQVLDRGGVSKLLELLDAPLLQKPLVINRAQETWGDWPFADVRDVVVVPIRQDRQTSGWIIAFNHTGDSKLGSIDFGTTEASLLNSVATILGIHAGNIALYLDETNLFEEMVRSMTSAIDAKDPYTCGHSDRVARVSVKLAQQLGLSTEDQSILYLGGLLHDIGKIGIDDQVLCKMGPLTDEEFEHIKTHPELGYRILKGIKRLESVLPVVLHHHEAWDGSGYPAGLKGEQTPFIARICAVADAFDAMSSDRPYRKGMDATKLDLIIREGAGSQWDPEVVDAFFAVREEIAELCCEDRPVLNLDVGKWAHQGHDGSVSR